MSEIKSEKFINGSYLIGHNILVSLLFYRLYSYLFKFKNKMLGKTWMVLSKYKFSLTFSHLYFPVLLILNTLFHLLYFYQRLQWLL